MKKALLCVLFLFSLGILPVQHATAAQVNEVKWIFKENPLPFGGPIFTGVYYDGTQKKTAFSDKDTYAWLQGTTIDYDPSNGLLSVHVAATNGGVDFILDHTEILTDNVGLYFHDIAIRVEDATIEGKVEVNKVEYDLEDIFSSGFPLAIDAGSDALEIYVEFRIDTGYSGDLVSVTLGNPTEVPPTVNTIQYILPLILDE